MLLRHFLDGAPRVPVMISGTCRCLWSNIIWPDCSGIPHSVKHIKPFSIGFNCALGAEQMRPYIDEISKIADTNICTFPNAGLPNEFGEYDESPEYVV